MNHVSLTIRVEHSLILFFLFFFQLESLHQMRNSHFRVETLDFAALHLWLSLIGKGSSPRLSEVWTYKQKVLWLFFSSESCFIKTSGQVFGEPWLFGKFWTNSLHDEELEISDLKPPSPRQYVRMLLQSAVNISKLLLALIAYYFSQLYYFLKVSRELVENLAEVELFEDVNSLLQVDVPFKVSSFEFLHSEFFNFCCLLLFKHVVISLLLDDVSQILREIYFFVVEVFFICRNVFILWLRLNSLTSEKTI